jgi:hypothetical protein
MLVEQPVEALPIVRRGRGSGVVHVDHFGFGDVDDDFHRLFAGSGA